MLVGQIKTNLSDQELIKTIQHSREAVAQIKGVTLRAMMERGLDIYEVEAALRGLTIPTEVK